MPTDRYMEGYREGLRRAAEISRGRAQMQDDASYRTGKLSEHFWLINVYRGLASVFEAEAKAVGGDDVQD